MVEDDGDTNRVRRTDSGTWHGLSRRTFMTGVGALTGVGATVGGATAQRGGVKPGSDALRYVFERNGNHVVASSRTGGIEYNEPAAGNAEEAFQFAFDALPDRGGTVIAGPGEFQFGGPATMDDGTVLTGSGSTRFVASATGSRVGFTERELQVGHDLLRVRGDDVAVTNVEFDAADTRLDNHAIQARGCDGLLIANNRTVDGFQMAISYVDCRNVVVRGNEVLDPNWYGITSRGAREDIDLRKSSDVLIAGNRVTDVTFNNIAPYNSSNFSVVGNRCYRGGHSLIACSPSQQGTIVGNVCRDLELEPIAADPGGEAGLEIEYKETHIHEAVADTEDETSLDITIANNHVENCGVGFICRTVPADEADSDAYRQEKRPYSFSVTGNAINGCDTGILLRSGSDGVVATNTLRNNDTHLEIDAEYTENVEQGLNVTRG